MYLIMAIVFVLGYAAIATEHNIKVNKAATAMLMAVILWTCYVIGKGLFMGHDEAALGQMDGVLKHHLGEIAEITFFLMGAMTIVEMIDIHGGFDLIRYVIQAKDKRRLLWSISIFSFFLSGVLDNMTTTILMVTVMRKLLSEKEDQWLFAGFIIIASNAGGAFSPIGDVTTTMLWIGGQITATNIILKLFLPSIACLLVPLALASTKVKGVVVNSSLIKENEDPFIPDEDYTPVREWEKYLVFFLGIGGLLFVPVFKYFTHLPPYMAILLAVGVLWVVTEILHHDKELHHYKQLSVAGVLARIDTGSVLFFLGILLAVSALSEYGHLHDLASGLNAWLGDIYQIDTIIGLLSAIVDNVPLVAGAKEMYSLNTYPTDNDFWELLAYCAGTGGSCLIIGSAAGVAAMGILNIEFGWYVKKISPYAIIGYFSGIIVFYLQHLIVG